MRDAQLRSAETAADLMMRFAERTGLSSARPPRRYLWTDAFAVCNFLGLARVAKNEPDQQGYLELAVRLVDQVHEVLGRQRADDSNAGKEGAWLSGLSEEEGAAHPTRGGLRIGKPLPDRGPREPFDEHLEWDRDGQYFHYLTKWMHALDQVSRATGQQRFNLWARELAHVAHRAFTRGAPAGGGKHMVWKMSVDLSRPQVPSMGQHDPLDGWITCTQVQTTASLLPGPTAGPNLDEAIADFAAMSAGAYWLTLDPLGLGGLLMDAGRVAQLRGQGAFTDGALLQDLLRVVIEGLPLYARQNDLRQPAARRLAFRELGLAIGLQAAEIIQATETGAPRAGPSHDHVRAWLGALGPYAALGTAIESFWLDPTHREAPTWSEHRDINEVMLATSLAPEGCLFMPVPRPPK